MFEVQGFWPTLAAGLMGGLIGELIRIAEALKDGKGPRGSELLGSLLYAVMGAGVIFYGWDRSRSALELAQLGAAFPLIFSTGVKSLRKAPPRRGGSLVIKGGKRRPPEPLQRSLTDYMTGRF